MQKPSTITEEMEKSIEAEVAKLVPQDSYDAPREVFGVPRIRRRPVSNADSESVEPAPAHNPEPAPAKEIDATDPINHPKYYNSHPSGVECITVVEWMSFNLGNAVKYIWRAGMKGYQIEDLQKARWYIDRELKRLGAE